jgi:hypothetical protein
MSVCDALHLWANSLPVFRFPFDAGGIPLSGLYILFERGEFGHATNRIVRVGTHTGANQLRSRLCQHFLIENKDRSIFRKNIGRALLNRDNDPFLPVWELDRTSRKMRNQHNAINMKRQAEIEKSVSAYIRDHLGFVVVRVDEKVDRLRLEAKMISTVSLCEECQPSAQWLGLFSPKAKIRESGLWLVNELYKEPLSIEDLTQLNGTRGPPTVQTRGQPP